MSEQAPVGFLGLGLMGAAIAGRMADAGTPLLAWNRSRSARHDELTARGASHTSSVMEALAAPISFSMLANDGAVDSVLSSANLGWSRIPRIHVNLASISAPLADTLSQRFADAGATYVSAPVLGRPEVAEAGKLNILMAGPASALGRVEPLLVPVSARRWHIGPEPRQANAVKIAMNFMILHALEAMGEGIALVEAEGVEASDFAEVFTSTLFPGPVYAGYGDMIANRRYHPPGFTAELGLKDLGLAERLAAERRLDLPSAPALRARFQAVLADPHFATGDWSVIAEVGRTPVVLS